jgi:hypothetical protein
VKLSASIMAHPDRADLVAELLAALDRPAQVAWDDEGPPSGNSDRVWRTARRGWELADPTADFHVLIQDDAVLSADFLAGLERALEHVPPDAVVSPYLGRGGAAGPRWERIGAEAERRSASWVLSSKVMWGVALVLPVARIPDLIGLADTMAGVPDDMRVAGWARRRHAEVWYPWPSLVDHRPVPSITKHRAADRHAVRHHTGSALEIDWSGPVVQDPMYAILRGPRSGPSKNRKVTSLQRRSAPGR